MGSDICVSYFRRKVRGHRSYAFCSQFSPLPETKIIRVSGINCSPESYSWIEFRGSRPHENFLVSVFTLSSSAVGALDVIASRCVMSRHSHPNSRHETTSPQIKAAKPNTSTKPALHHELKSPLPNPFVRQRIKLLWFPSLDTRSRLWLRARRTAGPGHVLFLWSPCHRLRFFWRKAGNKKVKRDSCVLKFSAVVKRSGESDCPDE